MFDLLDLQKLLPQEISPDYQKQRETVDSYLHRMGRAFTPDFLEDFQLELDRLAALERDRAFLSGLRLGVDLSTLLAPPLSRMPRP
uniref:hypothetical protein n=1 Tax=uncultured Flavonifractor sp. TaxID=1193534 RepID=UPI002606D4A1|nr:hypothetical protein [uncultured Flavonifractor sp.]